MSDPSEFRLDATGIITVLSPGQHLGKYELVKLLGEGAMGQVFLARHQLLGREVALKVLRTELAQRDDAVRRFFQEARSVNQINHENIVQISDFVQEPPLGMTPGRVYFVMEVVRGESLSQVLRTTGLSIAETIEVARQVGAALGAAHAVGVVHRDVKPDNILVERREDRLVVKVLDFGVAKLSRADMRVVDTTQAGAVIGTPLYMSPEQASALDVDLRADVYGLGAVLYEALSGHPPFMATTLGLLIAQLVRDEAPPLSAATPRGEAVPPSVAAAVAACLSKQPADRPATMAELVRLLNVVKPAPPTVDPVAPTEPPLPVRVQPSAATAPAPLVGSATNDVALEAFPSHSRRNAIAVGGVVGLVLVGSVFAYATHTHVAPATQIEVTPPLAPPPAAPVALAPPPTPTPPAPQPTPTPVEVAPTAAPTLAVHPTHTDEPAELAVVALRSGQPSFATVFVDGRRLGNAPIQRSIEPGHHVVHLERAGLKSEDRAVNVTPGQTIRLRVEMSP